MSNETPGATALAVTGVGLVTPVGADSVSSCLALQAGLARLAALDELPPQAYWDEGAVELEATGATARDVTLGHLGVDRLTRMAAPALQEALSQSKPAPATSPEAIVLLQVVAPASRAGRDDRLEQLFARRVERLCGVPAGRLNCRFVYGGHTGALAALSQAAALLDRREAHSVVVGCVDSLVEPATLQWLNQVRRLKAGGRVDGFCPGEAAAYLVVERPDDAARSATKPAAYVSGLMFAKEAATVASGKPSVGQGLGQAVRQTLAAVRDGPGTVGVVVSDLNGERYRALEWAYADMRCFAGVNSTRKLWHPADCIGDTGCASGGVSLAYAVTALKLGIAGTDRILVFSSSDDGERASAIVSPAPLAQAVRKQSA